MPPAPSCPRCLVRTSGRLFAASAAGPERASDLIACSQSDRGTRRRAKSETFLVQAFYPASRVGTSPTKKERDILRAVRNITCIIPTVRRTLCVSMLDSSGKTTCSESPSTDTSEACGPITSCSFAPTLITDSLPRRANAGSSHLSGESFAGRRSAMQIERPRRGRSPSPRLLTLGSSRGQEGRVKASGDGKRVGEPPGSDARPSTVKSTPILHLQPAIWGSKVGRNTVTSGGPVTVTGMAPTPCYHR